MSATDNVQGKILADVYRFLNQMDLEVCSCALPREMWRSLIQQCSSLTKARLDPDVPALRLASQVGLIDVFPHDRHEIMWGFRAGHRPC